MYIWKKFPSKELRFEKVVGQFKRPSNSLSYPTSRVWFSVFSQRKIFYNRRIFFDSVPDNEHQITIFVSIVRQIFSAFHTTFRRKTNMRFDRVENSLSSCIPNDSSALWLAINNFNEKKLAVVDKQIKHIFSCWFLRLFQTIFLEQKIFRSEQDIY